MRQQDMAYVDAAEVPGVVVMDGQAYGRAGGRWFPVKGVLRRGTGYIPVLDIPMMDEQSNRKAARA